MYVAVTAVDLPAIAIWWMLSMQSREARYTVVENTAMLYAINNATTTNNDNNTEDNVYV